MDIQNSKTKENFIPKTRLNWVKQLQQQVTMQQAYKQQYKQ